MPLELREQSSGISIRQLGTGKFSAKLCYAVSNHKVEAEVVSIRKKKHSSVDLNLVSSAGK
ncbi:MAG: hypothetical protein EB120_06390 [Proteobacteria bacterium]|nr:hypothetical protein [Pseudomonadota bacterium]NDG26785.1 hypothetical protein [Pseudomonadota bacterium]